MKLKITLLLISLLVLSGCATKKIIHNEPSKLAANGSEFKDAATVYVFRDAGGGYAWPVKILLNKEVITSVRPHTFAKFKVLPGSQTVDFSWNAMASMPNVNLEYLFESNKTYYFVFGSSVENLGWAFATDSQVGELTETEAQQRLNEYTLRKNVAKSQTDLPETNL